MSKFENNSTQIYNPICCKKYVPNEFKRPHLAIPQCVGCEGDKEYQILLIWAEIHQIKNPICRDFSD